jgi:hypothetical protein
VQIDLPSNQGAAEAIELLTPIQEQYSDIVTWADLIVYAGGIAVEEAGRRAGHSVLPWPSGCRGRCYGDFRRPVPRTYYKDPLVAARDNIKVRPSRMPISSPRR